MAAHLALVLHTHLPFVRHPEYSRSLEERWLYEAILECYLPLLGVLDRLERDRVPVALTMSLTPPLLAMWQDELLCSRFDAHLSRLQGLADREEKRLWGDRDFAPVAHYYAERLAELRERWHAIGGDLAGAFLRHWNEGRIEVIGCSATHAYLPGLLPTPRGLSAQLELGLVAVERALGRRPAGIWLPECAFHPAFEPELGRLGVRYVVVDTHALTRATPPVFAAPHRTAVSPNGTVYFARDPEASQAVWSRDSGYPGDPYYRDFYRDIGFDLPEDDLLGEIGPYGARISSGLKYHRITGKTEHKQPYVPEIALEHTFDHAGDFLRKRSAILREVGEHISGTPLCVAPYDSELFGHWWFEGPDFLEAVFRRLPEFPELTAVTLGGHLRRGGLSESAMPEASSWGAGGYGDVWVGHETGWFWRHIHHATRDVERAVQELEHERMGPRAEALDQAIVELLLLQSSDWPFIVKTNTTVQYAEARFRAHHHRLSHLLYLARKADWSDADAEFVRDVRARDNFMHDAPSYQLRAPFTRAR